MKRHLHSAWKWTAFSLQNTHFALLKPCTRTTITYSARTSIPGSENVNWEKGFYSACTAWLAIIKLATPQAGKQCSSSVPTQTVARMQTIWPKCNSQIALHAPCTQFGPCHETWAEQVSETTTRSDAHMYEMYVPTIYGMVHAYFTGKASKATYTNYTNWTRNLLLHAACPQGVCPISCLCPCLWCSAD